MKTNIKVLGVLLAVGTICTTLARAEDKPASAGAGASKVEDLFPDVVVIKGKGFEVRRSRFDEDMINVKAEAMSKGQEIAQAQLPVLQRRVLDRLILDQILLSKATAADKAKGKEEGDKQFELIRKNEPSDEVLSRKLRAVGLTADKFHARLIEQFTVQPMLRAKATITEAQVKKFYDDNPSKFEEPEMVRLSYILMATADPKTGTPLSDEQKKAKKKQMEDVLKRARAGDDFTKLAKEFSDDPRVKENGGEIKITHNNQGIPPEFEAAAFSLKTNQVSDVVNTMYGYCIIKLHENIPARKVALSETSKRVEEYLAQVEVEKMLPKYY